MLALFLCLSGCSSYKNFTYRIYGIDIFSQNNSGATPVDDSSGSIPASAYVLRMEYHAQVFAELGMRAEPGESEFRADKGPTSMNIFSTTRFDSAHDAMTSLNDCFATLVPGDRNGRYVYTHIDSNIFKYHIDFDAYHPYDPRSESNYYMLIKSPSTPGPRTFILSIVFTDSTWLSDTVSVNLY